MNENDILESCLEALQQGASLASCMKNHPELSNESLRILRAAVRLRTAGRELTPDVAFKRRSRGHLMQRIAAEQRKAMATTPASAPGKGRRLRQRWQTFWTGFSSPGMQWQPVAAVMALVIFLALGAGVVSAAQKAEPGDLLYPVRQLTEQVGTALKRNKETPSIEKTSGATITPSPQSIQPTATTQSAPQMLATEFPTTVVSTEQPAAPTTVPDTPVPPTLAPTATFTPPTPTALPTMPSHPTMQPTIVPTISPTLQPTTAPTMPPTKTPTTAPPSPMPTVTTAPPTSTPMPTVAPPPTATPAPTMAPPPTATPISAPTMSPTQSPPTPPSWP